jgi:protein farnesyltransferase subunit beta
MSQEGFTPWNALYALSPLRAVNSPEITDELLAQLTTFLSHRRCHGGFSGFSHDNIHLITLYAAIAAIANIGTQAAYELIDRNALYKAIMALKLPNGSFMTSLGQESDARSTFSALLAGHMTNILTPDFTSGCREYINSCSNYDGGFSPNPGLESHGGYVHCAVGALKILGCLDDLNFDKIIAWIAFRQMSFGGGFCGRPNKLIDSCYSWWVGVAARIIADHLGIPPFWNEEAMATFLLEFAQCADGGFCPRPPDPRDRFHSMYALAGLAVCGGRETGSDEGLTIAEMDPLIPCPKDKAEEMRAWFGARPFEPTE